MNSLHEETEENYVKCGEMFLTIKGNIAFHCTLCEEKFKDFQAYYDHILETHYAVDSKAELLTEFFDEEESEIDPLSEEAYSTNWEEYSINTEEEGTSEIFDLEEGQNEEIEIENLSEVDQDQTEDCNTIELVATIPKEVIRPKIRSVNVKTTIKDRKYKCPYCDFTGAGRANLYGHVARHSLKRPHKCQECDKDFYTGTELRVHMRLHTGERPYLCNLCGRSFITAGKLNDHQKRHINKRDKECPICKMAFVNTRGLSGHMAVHSEKRNFKCSICNGDFKTSDALRNHMKLHENKRAYQCKLCDSKFNQNSGLYSHMKISHKVVFNSLRANK